MAKEEVTLQSFSAGELAPNMYGRYELAVSKSGCKKLRNFIAETQGAARYRNGFKVVHNSRRNNVPFLIPFQFNDEQAYMLEFTSGYLRFHKDEGIIVESDKTITGITQASPGVITSVAHGYVTGNEIFINDVVGMTELNGKAFLVVRINNDTYSLTDQDGTAINTTAYTAYSSAGTTARIYEITTPYSSVLDLSKLKVTQNADTMYIVHPYYEPRKLTRSAHTSWTLLTYTRTDDPFLSKKNITAITLASPGVITSAGHGYTGGEIVIIEGIVGTTELNSRVFEVVYINANTFSLKDYTTDVAVNTTTYTAWSSAGYVSDTDLLPAAVAFYEGRWFGGGMAGNPSGFVGSQSPDPTSGDPRPDVFTAGTDADDAVYFSIADGEVNKIRWLVGTNRLIMAGTFGTEVRIAGETSDKPITPTSINVRAENRLGVQDIAPINKENIVIYVQRGGLTLRSFEFDALSDAFVSVDRNLVAEHITHGGITQIAWQTGRPDIVWCVVTDGHLIGLTFKSREDISGWHHHTTGGAFDDQFLSVATMPRPTQFEQLWAATEREIDGHTRRFIEFMTDAPEIPDLFDFYTDEDGEDADLEVYTRAMQEAMKGYIHLDCASTYDGTEAGSEANVTVTPSAVTGTAITMTASGSIFKASDVGRQIWKKAMDGIGQGRAEITAYSSATSVTCEVLDDFDNTTAIAAGEWYFTTDEITNLDYLEGREVAITADGAVHPVQTVTDGAISLDYQASKVHVGLAYRGFLEPMNIEAGGTTGPAQTKNRNVYDVGIRFLNTLGAKFGTDPYAPETVDFTNIPLQVGAPELLFTGVKRVHLSDMWDIDKTVFVMQDSPLPCIVQLLELYVETDNG